MRLIVILILTSFILPLQSLLCQDVNYGETYLTGTTWWFNQQNSTVGKTIARDENGGVHLVWTYGNDPDISERFIKYCFIYDNGGEIEEQIENGISRVDFSDRAGYASLDLRYTDQTITAVSFYHTFGQAAMAFDFEWGIGAFQPVYFDSPNRQVPLLVKGTIDQNGRAHVIAGTHNMGGDAVFPLVLWHAEPGEDMDDWTIGDPQTVDDMTGLTHHIKASRESEAVALVWHHNIVGVPAPESWANTIAYGMNNDLYLYESPDGQEWDVDNPFNITRTVLPDQHREGVLAYGDTLRPFNDSDILYSGEVLHVVFSARGFIGDPDMREEPPVLDITTRESLIWHWDSASDSLTLVANGWYENEGDPSSMHSNVSRPSMGRDEDGNLYCLFRQVTEDDVNRSGYCHGELMLSISNDDGISWSEAINLTGTTAENPQETEYIDECHPCLAELVDENLHIFYILAAESNQTPQEGLTEECRMTYQRVPVEELPDVDVLEMPRDGFQYHTAAPVHVGEDYRATLPKSLIIDTVHPNPFNSRTDIAYTLQSSGDVTLSILNLKGRVIFEEKSGLRSAGNYQQSIDGAELANGVYMVRLTVNSESAMRKIVCLK